MRLDLIILTPDHQSRRYSLEETADAIRYSEEGRARGKIVIGLE